MSLASTGLFCGRVKFRRGMDTLIVMVVLGGFDGTCDGITDKSI